MTDYKRDALPELPAPEYESAHIFTRGEAYTAKQMLDYALLALTRQPALDALPQATGNIATWPTEIWLQHGDGEVPSYQDGDEYSWCWHSIDDNDVKYVRADLPQPSPQSPGIDAVKVRDETLDKLWFSLKGKYAPLSMLDIKNAIESMKSHPLPSQPEPLGRVMSSFKNFHRALCARFDYPHDPIDWQRDQVSLEEHIAAILHKADVSQVLNDEEIIFNQAQMITGLRALLHKAGASGRDAPFDFHAHLARQAAWSEKTFGPGARTAGVCDHIRKELLEIEADPLDLKEWIDVVILALDGAWRCGGTPDQIIDGVVAKQTKNEGRVWPDWRTADPTKAIEHDRSHDALSHPSPDNGAAQRTGEAE